MISEGNQGRRDAALTIMDLPSEPITRIEVTRIQFYTRNPRRQVNPEYDRIKASIQSQGLDQPLVITRQPDSDDYMLQAGGNTRLRILKELYEETGEQQFYCVNCLVKPWVDESSVLLAHLRENELRGHLSFIDKAQAVCEARQLLQGELELDELSVRRLARIFRERGFTLSPSMISQMDYAVHTLLPLIPEALANGLGRPQVERIRALERAARQIWLRRDLGDDATFDGVFAALCQRYDGAEWDILLLKAALENEIAEEAEQALQVIRLELDECLAGRVLTIIEINEADTEPSASCAVGADEVSDEESEIAIDSSVPGIPEARPGQTGQADIDNEQAVSRSPSLPSAEREQVQAQMTVGSDLSEDHPPAVSVRPNDLDPSNPEVEALRTQAWTLAERLASRNGLRNCVTPTPGQGLGFIVLEVPDPTLADSLDQSLLGQVSTLWWQLAACAETTVAPVECQLPYLKQGAILRQALETGGLGLLFDRVWTPDPGHTGQLLWQQLNDQDWQDLLQLMETYRRLKRLSITTGIPVWSHKEGVR